MEVTLRIRNALLAIEPIAAEVPERCPGAGGVCRAEQSAEAGMAFVPGDRPAARVRQAIDRAAREAVAPTRG